MICGSKTDRSPGTANLSAFFFTLPYALSIFRPPRRAEKRQNHPAGNRSDPRLFERLDAPRRSTVPRGTGKNSPILHTPVVRPIAERLPEPDPPPVIRAHECGTNPTAEELAATSWTYFMTWHTEHIVDKNDPEALNTLYNSELVITKDELPEKWIE